MRHPLLTIFALVAAAGCSSMDQSTGPTVNHDADQVTSASLARGAHQVLARPLSGRCSTIVTRLAPPPIEVQRIEYTCRISHLGLSHAVVIQTLDVATGDITNAGDFVAANGDKLSSNFAGTATLSFTDPANATVRVHGTQSISPGTGRFVQATGTANLVGSAHINLITGSATGEFTLDGTLAY
jgi:hypothetical protein